MKSVLKKSILLFMCLSFLFLVACDKKSESNQAQNKNPENEKTENITTENIVSETQEPVSQEEKDTDKNLPKLLDLGAHKCKPCIMMAPILDELRVEYKGVFDVVFVDVWQPENKPIAQKHGIQAIPTQIFFDENGNELSRHTGFLSKEDILSKWKELGYSFSEPRDTKTPTS